MQGILDPVQYYGNFEFLMANGQKQLLIDMELKERHGKQKAMDLFLVKMGQL